MKDRRREMIPIDKIKIINSRTRDESQFAMNVQSIEAVGQIKDIRVNDRFLQSEGWYELIYGEGRLIAQKRIGRTQIRAEIVNCDRKQAYLESLVENLTRSRANMMEFAREIKLLHDEGWTFERIARTACRSADYIRHYIQLIENGEQRLLMGVESGVFPISFALLVAQSDDAAVQNVLMDAFDQGIVNCENFARAKTILSSRLDNRRRKNGQRLPKDYTVASLKQDIGSATESKDSYVREAQAKEGRLFTLLDCLNHLWKDSELLCLLKAENLEQIPELSGNYALKS
jgi:ParB family chromosome partitioning protein